MPEKVEVELLDKTGMTTKGVLSYASEAPWFINFYSSSLGSYTINGDDLFDTLCNLRIKLEQGGWYILCSGARIDAYPSRMSRQMSGGQKLYILETGKPASIQDLVDIFQPSSADKVGTVNEQLTYYKKWLASL